jgi:2-isopropylmalate synthase
VPALRELTLGVDCADTLSLAGASAVAAVRAGAGEVKASVCDCGAPPLAAVTQILTTRDVSCGVRSTELLQIAAQVRRLTTAGRGKNSPFENGAGSSEGQDLILCRGDERQAVSLAAAKLGYDLSPEDTEKVFEAFGAVARGKEQISGRELDTIIASVAMQVPATYVLGQYLITAGNTTAATALVKVTRDGRPLEGLCTGDGPIDAAFLALEQITGQHYELDEFQIQSVTEGREAMGETIVHLRSGGKLYSGRGISTDIIGASIAAYLSAANKIAYEEAHA